MNAFRRLLKPFSPLLIAAHLLVALHPLDANGNPLTTTDPLNATTTRTFDPATGKQLTEQDPLGHSVTWSYPTAGAVYQRLNLGAYTDARGNTTTYDYGPFASQAGAPPQTITEPLGRVTVMTHQNLHRLSR